MSMYAPTALSPTSLSTDVIQPDVTQHRRHSARRHSAPTSLSHRDVTQYRRHSAKCCTYGEVSSLDSVEKSTLNQSFEDVLCGFDRPTVFSGDDKLIMERSRSTAFQRAGGSPSGATPFFDAHTGATPGRTPGRTPHGGVMTPSEGPRGRSALSNIAEDSAAAEGSSDGAPGTPSKKKSPPAVPQRASSRRGVSYGAGQLGGGRDQDDSEEENEDEDPSKGLDSAGDQERQSQSQQLSQLSRRSGEQRVEGEQTLHIFTCMDVTSNIVLRVESML